MASFHKCLIQTRTNNVERTEIKPTHTLSSAVSIPFNPLVNQPSSDSFASLFSALHYIDDNALELMDVVFQCFVEKIISKLIDNGTNHSIKCFSLQSLDC